MIDILTEQYRWKMKWLFDNHYVIYDRDRCDYYFKSKTEVLTDKEIKFLEAMSWKKVKYSTDWKKENKNEPKKKMDQPLRCPHCGYVYWSKYTGAYFKHHGKNCKHKPQEE